MRCILELWFGYLNLLKCQLKYGYKLFNLINESCGVSIYLRIECDLIMKIRAISLAREFPNKLRNISECGKCEMHVGKYIYLYVCDVNSVEVDNL